jgi:hypothetical protein
MIFSNRACAAAIALAVAVALGACASKQPGRADPEDVETVEDGSDSDSSKPSGQGKSCKKAGPSNVCGLTPQCGCKEGETCDVLDETGATGCLAGGTVALGHPCTDTKQCAAGLTCAYGACRPYCGEPNKGCSDEGAQLCVQARDKKGEPILNAAMCTVGCDPRNPEPACGTNSCLWFATYYAPFKVSDCNTAGTKGAGEACQADAECKPGFGCGAHPTRGQECEHWCLMGAQYCAAGTECVDVYGTTAPTVGGVREGLCR